MTTIWTKNELAAHIAGALRRDHEFGREDVWVSTRGNQINISIKGQSFVVSVGDPPEPGPYDFDDCAY
jgi:hypothetical protein